MTETLTEPAVATLSAPMILYVFTLVLGVAALVVFLMKRVKGCNAKAAIAKSWVSVCFMLTGFSALAVKGFSAFQTLICAGLLFGLLGDIWLDLKFCYPRDNDTFTKQGFLSFGIGHVFFCAAVIAGVAGGFKAVSILPALGVAVVAALVVWFGEKAMGLHYGKYKLISTVYGGVLFFMAAFAFFCAVFSGFAPNRHLIVMAIGGVFFIISDMILSGTYFGKDKNRPVDIIVNHVTYYIAQFIIASAVLFMAAETV